MRRISLDQLTVIGVSPAELVTVAAEAGYGAIGPFISAGGSGLAAEPLLAGSPGTLEMMARLRDSDVVVNNVDGFVLHPALRIDDYRPGLSLARELGARNVVTLGFDPEEARAMDHFCQLAEAARAEGLGVVLEFTPLSRIAGLSEALDWLRRAAQPNARVLIDLLHLMQSGGSPDDIRGVEPALIGGAQLCDGPLNPSFKTYAFNALHERQSPGEGQLPVVDFLAALPADLVFGVEIPQQQLASAGVSHLERARRLMAATRACLSKAGRA